MTIDTNEIKFSVEMALTSKVGKMQVCQACVGKAITISQLKLGISSIQEFHLLQKLCIFPIHILTI